MGITRFQAVVATTVAFSLVGAGLWLSGSDIQAPRAGNGPVPAHDPAGLAIEQRMSRLEAEIQALKVEVSRNPRDTRLMSAREPSRIEAGDVAKHREKFKAELSSSFAAQPIDTAWARRTRVELEEQLIATAVEQSDFPAPQTARMQCRSTTCRIEADYPDEDSALYGVQLLQSAFSSRLPRAHQYSVTNPDGSVTIVMYASKGST